MQNAFVITLVAICMAVLVRQLWTSFGTKSVMDVLGGIDAPEKLKARLSENKEAQVTEVVKGVHVATNYALANSILLEGVGGKVIVDTTESLTSATKIAAAFNKITREETKAIIYTHHHADHIMGAQAFVSANQTDVDIWAHPLFFKEEARITMAGPAHFRRAMYQFGVFVDKARMTAGIGSSLNYDPDTPNHRMEPTQIMDKDEMDINVAGIKMKLIHIPGESSDQIGVWLPDKRVLLCADDMYKAFPNLYAIRGVTPRDIMDWANSLDKMRRLRPQCIVGSHGYPVCGEDEIYELFTNYMLAIQFVHDQTVRYINQGVHPDEIAKLVKLPKKLAEHPYLIEYYGTTHWSVKAVFIMYMGWFSGEAVDLDPLTPTGRAERMLKLLGRSGLLKEADRALSSEDLQWALELATYVQRLDPDDSWARRIRKSTLAKLASLQMSAPGRNWYMTEILRDEGLLPVTDIKKNALVRPVTNIFQALRTRLRAEALPDGEHMTGCWYFTDSQLHVTATIDSGVLYVEFEESQSCDFKIVCEEIIWKELAAQLRTSMGAYLSGNIKVEGSIFTLRRYMNYFDRN